MKLILAREVQSYDRQRYLLKRDRLWALGLTANGKPRAKKPASYRGSPEYRAWMAMRSRCNNRHTSQYKNYGARGIKVCDRWDDFELFLSDVGARPSVHHSLDRIDVNGNYEPGNCRWADQRTQARNHRPGARRRFITAFGETKLAIEWSEDPRCKCSFWSIVRRIKAGWDSEKAITTGALQ